MQINIPKDIEALIRERAAAAGFAGEIDAYVAHLVKADQTEDFGAPAHLTLANDSKSELDSIIEAGMESGPATVMADTDWQKLRKRIDDRQSN